MAGGHRSNPGWCHAGGGQGKLQLCYRAPGGGDDTLVVFREKLAEASLSTPPPDVAQSSTVLFLDNAGTLYLLLLKPEELAKNFAFGQMNHVAQFLKADSALDLTTLAVPAARVQATLAAVPPHAQDFVLLGSGGDYPTFSAFVQAVGATGGAYPLQPGQSLAGELKAWLEHPGGERLNLLVERQPTLEQSAYQEVQAMLDFIRGDVTQADLAVDARPSP